MVVSIKFIPAGYYHKICHYKEKIKEVMTQGLIYISSRDIRIMVLFSAFAIESDMTFYFLLLQMIKFLPRKEQYPAVDLSLNL